MAETVPGIYRGALPVTSAYLGHWTSLLLFVPQHDGSVCVWGGDDGRWHVRGRRMGENYDGGTSALKFRFPLSMRTFQDTCARPSVKEPS